MYSQCRFMIVFHGWSLQIWVKSDYFYCYDLTPRQKTFVNTTVLKRTKRVDEFAFCALPIYTMFTIPIQHERHSSTFKQNIFEKLKMFCNRRKRVSFSKKIPRIQSFTNCSRKLYKVRRIQSHRQVERERESTEHWTVISKLGCTLYTEQMCKPRKNIFDENQPNISAKGQPGIIPNIINFSSSVFFLCLFCLFRRLDLLLLFTLALAFATFWCFAVIPFLALFAHCRDWADKEILQKLPVLQLLCMIFFHDFFPSFFWQIFGAFPSFHFSHFVHTADTEQEKSTIAWIYNYLFCW